MLRHRVRCSQHFLTFLTSLIFQISESFQKFCSIRHDALGLFNFSVCCSIRHDALDPPNPANLDIMKTALVVPDDPHCPSWCPSVPSHLLSCPSTSTYLSCHRRIRFLVLGVFRTSEFLSKPMTTVRFFSGLIFHDLCEFVWCSGLNVLPGTVRNIAVNSPGYLYPYVLSCKQVAAVSKLPPICFTQRVHPWSSQSCCPDSHWGALD